MMRNGINACDANDIGCDGDSGGIDWASGIVRGEYWGNGGFTVGGVGFSNWKLASFLALIIHTFTCIDLYKLGIWLIFHFVTWIAAYFWLSNRQIMPAGQYDVRWVRYLENIDDKAHQGPCISVNCLRSLWNLRPPNSSLLVSENIIALLL